MVKASAPGKLYIAGEYAVVEPGHPSIVIAVDRFITVQLEEADECGTIRSLQYGNEAIQWKRKQSRLVLEEKNESFSYVLAAIHIAEQWLKENGKRLSFYHLLIESELDSESGQKYGLGSSGAVTVAVIRGLLRYYKVKDSDELVYKLAALAHLSLGSNGSFGDLAASSYTGWIAYSSFDREIVRQWMKNQTITEVVKREWPSLSIERLAPPKQLHLVIGWTGSPASTTNLVDKVKGIQTESATSYADFLSESKECVQRMIASFREENLSSIQMEIRKNRSLLNQLREITGVVIETPALTQLCETAEEYGGAAKSSGAGGGDCGIALFNKTADLSDMLQQWKKDGITELPMNVFEK